MSILHILAPFFFEDEIAKKRAMAAANEEYYKTTLDLDVSQLIDIYEKQSDYLDHKNKDIKAHAHAEYMMLCAAIQKNMAILDKEFYNFTDDYMLKYDKKNEILYLKSLLDIQRDSLTGS